ncbi:MAG TPA: AAA family ATPase [Tissierellaceae bacterium]
MRIEKLILKNYRQFKDMIISFNKTSIHDVHVCIGVMGTGKTNLLNAINWCLYGEEPFLSKESYQLPLLNLKAILETQYGENKDVLVEVWAETEDHRHVIFTRKATFRVYNQGEAPQKQEIIFEVKVPDSKGNVQILRNEEAEQVVERFVPSKIREFFFFDGERLDKYFKEATGQNIRHAVSVISQIEIIERICTKRIEPLLKDIRREASKANPKIEEIREILEQKENEYKEINNQIEECIKQIKIAKEKIEEYREKLKDLPDAETLEKERENLIQIKKEKEEHRNEKIKDKLDLLYEYGKIMMFWLPIKKSIDIIENKKKDKEIPPTIDRSLLENIIKNGECSLCGRKLDSEAKRRVEDLLKEIRLSSEIAQQLLYMESPLIQYAEKIKNFKREIEKITKNIQEYDRELTEIEGKISTIDKKLSGYNIEKIREWHKKRKEFEKIYDDNQQRLGILKANKEQLEGEIKSLNKELDEEINKEKKVRKLKKQIDFCTKALHILDLTRKKIMTEIRNNIESETQQLFFNLIWKKGSFKNVTIDDDYNINLIHSMGYECLGTISGGEREVLTLAFTMALHKISGFNSPIIIDRPLAMVSGEPRKNIVDVFSQISKNKQVILLFTPDDYSVDISSILDSKASNRYKLIMSQDEKEVQMEVL